MMHEIIVCIVEVAVPITFRQYEAYHGQLHRDHSPLDSRNGQTNSNHSASVSAFPSLVTSISPGLLCSQRQQNCRRLPHDHDQLQAGLFGPFSRTLSLASLIYWVSLGGALRHRAPRILHLQTAATVGGRLLAPAKFYSSSLSNLQCGPVPPLAASA